MADGKLFIYIQCMLGLKQCLFHRGSSVIDRISISCRIPCMPPPHSNHTRPPGATTHAPWATTHAPPQEQPCMPPEQPCTPPRSNHAWPPSPSWATTHAPLGATMHTPLWTECGHTRLKILPCPNFVAGGNNNILSRINVFFVCNTSCQGRTNLYLFAKSINTYFKEQIIYLI